MYRPIEREIFTGCVFYDHRGKELVIFFKEVVRYSLFVDVWGHELWNDTFLGMKENCSQLIDLSKCDIILICNVWFIVLSCTVDQIFNVEIFFKFMIRGDLHFLDTILDKLCIFLHKISIYHYINIFLLHRPLKKSTEFFFAQIY